MRTVSDMWSPTIIDYEKYYLYLKLRKEFDDFLVDLKRRRTIDWKIHKTLVDAGGLGDSVYLHIPRGISKTQLISEHIEELKAKGKDVYTVTYPRPKPTQRDIDHLKSIVIDRDLIPLNNWGRGSWGEYFYETLGIRFWESRQGQKGG